MRSNRFSTYSNSYLFKLVNIIELFSHSQSCILYILFYVHTIPGGITYYLIHETATCTLYVFHDNLIIAIIAQAYYLIMRVMLYSIDM